ncbi:MAG TPA: hypothetical protein VHC43_10810 [Mycobacteriales bacterium]|nr:hypothetical protein [Mycobacteriales bacterium]
MAACARCATQLRADAQVCTACGLVQGSDAPAATPSPPIPMIPAPVLPPVENPWRTSEPTTPQVMATSRYGVPEVAQRPAEPIMPPNPFAKGAQTDRGALPPQMPVRHESASIPVAFAQFSEPEPALGDGVAAADTAEVVVLHRASLAEALEAALADLPEDAPDHYEAEPEPFPEVLSVAPPRVAMPGWS